jgi:hypothetical protein
MLSLKPLQVSFPFNVILIDLLIPSNRARQILSLHITSDYPGFPSLQGTFQDLSHISLDKNV